MRLQQSSRARAASVNQKSINNQFRSQKILFTTPIAVSSRPPVALSIKNDSISLDLDDTHVKSDVGKERRPQLDNGVDTTMKYLSPIKESVASKKMLPNEEKQTSNILTVNGVEYVLNRKIGSGGSSSVFLARQKGTDLECAVKVRFAETLN
jgi:serine/threonine-protein kinase TTK/MPS1